MPLNPGSVVRGAGASARACGAGSIGRVHVRLGEAHGTALAASVGVVTAQHLRHRDARTSDTVERLTAEFTGRIDRSQVAATVSSCQTMLHGQGCSVSALPELVERLARAELADLADRVAAGPRARASTRELRCSGGSLSYRA